MRDHTKLRAFELADKVALETYRITQNFPREEEFGLSSQMRKACVSVPSNIVEGCARNTTKDFLRFLDISFGSVRELHYQFTLAYRLNYIKHSTDSYENLLNETEKVIGSLIRSMRK